MEAREPSPDLCCTVCCRFYEFSFYEPISAAIGTPGGGRSDPLPGENEGEKSLLVCTQGKGQFERGLVENKPYFVFFDVFVFARKWQCVLCNMQVVTGHRLKRLRVTRAL